MNRIARLSLIALGTAAFVAGCGNPADKTADAQVGEAKETETQAAAEGTTYAIDVANSAIGFTGSKVTGSHSGQFTAFQGAITVADGKIASPSSVTIDMDSLETDNNKLTGHLKNADFFDVPTYPTSTFTFISAEPAAEGGHTLTGNLDLHGVEKSVAFPATIDITEEALHLKAEFDIKRFDWNIAYKGRADDLIRDEVVIALDIHAAVGE